MNPPLSILITALTRIPSFYGALLWWFWLLVYCAVPIGWETPQPHLLWCYVAIGSCLVASTTLSYRTAARPPPKMTHPAMSLILCLSAIGLGGIVLHLLTLAQSFHGVGNVLYALLSRSFEIRWENAEVTSIGTQFSYFGWLVCGLLAVQVPDRSLSFAYRALAAGLWITILLFNFAMIDRTRPFWIVATSILMILSSYRMIATWKIVVASVLTPIVLLSIFLGVAIWSGKLGEHSPGRSQIEAAIFNLSLYGAGGFAYFDHITTYFHMPEFLPERTLYPLFKLLAFTGIAHEPPSQILEFENVPYEVNVGTLLTPLYLDGGWIFVIVLTPLLIYFIDRLALSFLYSPSPIKRYAWATLCYSQALAFFSSPLNSTPCWLFISLGIIAVLFFRKT